MSLRTLLAAAVTCGLVTAPSDQPLDAQVRASERGGVHQTVDGTVITVDYSRPRARGRAPIFGEVVHWGETWTPGANDATTLEVSRDVELNGHPVPAGTYSVWMVVEAEEEWELILDPRADLFHTEHPERTDDQIRLTVAREETEPLEVLTWSVPTYTTSTATLVMAWGEVRVPLKIEVEPSMRRVVTEEEAAPYLGAWEMTSVVPPGVPGGGEEMDPAPFVVDHKEDGTLRATTHLPFPDAPDPAILMLMPVAEGIFVPGMMVEGELRETFQGVFLEFSFEGERAVSFALRTEEDQVMSRGKRKDSGS